MYVCEFDVYVCMCVWMDVFLDPFKETRRTLEHIVVIFSVYVCMYVSLM
jgi:hypothetical protein